MTPTEAHSIIAEAIVSTGHPPDATASALSGLRDADTDRILQLVDTLRANPDTEMEALLLRHDEDRGEKEEAQDRLTAAFSCLQYGQPSTTTEEKD